MQPVTEVSFLWRRWELKEAVFAITKAVAAGCDTKDSLQAALPQFSPRRIALAIDLLIAADMADVKLGVLEVHSDMDVVFGLLKNEKFVLPLSLEEARAPGMCRKLIHGLGCRNPAGVEALVRMDAGEA